MSEYAFTSLGGRTITKHKKIWEETHGEVPKGYVIHHINGDKKDNRIENLECLSQKEHKARHKQIVRTPSSYNPIT